MQTQSKQSRSKASLQQGRQILLRRKEIEQELADMLKETESDFSLQDVKDAIYREQDNGDFHKLIAMFDRGGDISELENALDIVGDAWNYFPHKVLERAFACGKSIGGARSITRSSSRKLKAQIHENIY